MNDTRTFYSRCPIVKQESAALMAWRQPISGVGRPMLEAFRADIMWLRESESQILAMHGGNEFQALGTCTDFYGYMTSVKGSIEAAVGMCDSYKITPKSSLSLVVRTTIRDIPVMGETKEIIQGYQRTQFTSAPNNWYWYDAATLKINNTGATDEERMSRDVKGLESVERFKKIVWSSHDAKHPDVEKLMEMLRLKAEGEPKKKAPRKASK